MHPPIGNEDQFESLKVSRLQVECRGTDAAQQGKAPEVNSAALMHTIITGLAVRHIGSAPETSRYDDSETAAALRRAALLSALSMRDAC